MKTKNMRGNSSVISDYVGIVGRLNVQQMREMLNYGWEFNNHTVSHPNLSTLSLPEVEYEISHGLEFLLNFGAGKSSYFFVEPSSILTGERYAIEEKYVTMRRQSGSSIYTPIPVLDAMNIRRFSADTITPVSEITNAIEIAITNKLWLVLVFHRLADIPTEDPKDYSTANFQSVIDYLDTNKSSIKTVTAGEALYYG
jgi:hypothetical protein